MMMMMVMIMVLTMMMAIMTMMVMTKETAMMMLLRIKMLPKQIPSFHSPQFPPPTPLSSFAQVMAHISMY